jgi:Co/Zn/Cd efflux system component
MHSHPHRHEHHHHTSRATLGRAFAIGIGLNAAFVVVEWIFGAIANSLALIADATHNLSDVLGLVLAWGAAMLARRPPSARFTYGLRSSTILAALANAMILLVVTGGIAWEAILRFQTASAVDGAIMIWVAALGVVINAATAMLFIGRRNDLNVHGAFLHMATDAAVSLGVVLAGIGMIVTGWLWLDTHLGDEYYGNCVDRALGNAGRASRRRLFQRRDPPHQGSFPHRTYHYPDRDRCCSKSLYFGSRPSRVMSRLGKTRCRSRFFRECRWVKV